MHAGQSYVAAATFNVKGTHTDRQTDT